MGEEHYVPAALIATGGAIYFFELAPMFVTIGLVGLGISMELNMAMAPDPPSINIPSNSIQQNGHLLNTRATTAVLPVVGGEFKVGGNLVYSKTTGANNETLHLIITLCEGEIDSLAQDAGRDRIYLDDIIIDDYGSDATYEFFPGSESQNVCGLQAFDASWVYKQRRTAYLYIRLNFNAGKFNGLPNVTAVIKGRKLYDPRDSSTAYSTNPALFARDNITNQRYGIGLDTSYLDDDFFKTAATWCDTNQYYFNGGAFSQKDSLDVINAILLNFRGSLFWTNGEYKLIIKDYDATVLTIAEAEIVEDSFSFRQPSMQDTPNRINIKFPSTEIGWKAQTLSLETNDYIDIGDDDRKIEIELIGTTDYEQAHKLGAYLLERAAFNKIFRFAMGSRGLVLEPGDIIKVTHSLPGWSEHICRVIESKANRDGTVSLTVLDEDEDLYDDTVNISSHTQPTTTLLDPLAIPPNTENIVTTDTFYTQGDKTFWRLAVTFDAPSDYPYYKHSEAWISYDGGVNYSYLRSGTVQITLDPVLYGQLIYIKLRTVSVYDIKEVLADALSASTTVGASLPAPGNVTGFRIAVDLQKLSFSWNPVGEDQGIKYYEIRFGGSWETSFFIAKTRATSYSIGNIKPGVHTFRIRAVTVDDQVSPNSTTAIAKVPLPPGLVLDDSDADDFTTGTHYGTERFNHGTYGFVLQVDHDDRLYGGTGVNGQLLEFDNTSAWDLVAAQLSGETDIESTVNQNGIIYGTSFNDGKLYRYDIVNENASAPTPVGSWVQVAGQFESETTLLGLISFEGDIYCGGGTTGKILKWDRVSAWIEVADQFDSETIKCSVIYNSLLYFGTASLGKLLVLDVSAGTLSQAAGQSGSETSINALKVYDDGGGDGLFGGTSPNGTLVKFDDSSAWDVVAPQLNSQTDINDLIIHDDGGGDDLYGCTSPNGRLFEFNDSNLWVQKAPELDSQTDILSMAIHATKLYGSTSPGGRLFEYNDSNAWVQKAPQLGSETDVKTLVEWDAVDGNILGTYLSPKYDRGAVELRFHYLDLTPQFDGDGDTWESVFGAAQTWEEAVTSEQNWYQILGGFFSFADIDIILWYSDDDTTWYKSHMFYIQSAWVEARYKYVQVVLKDSSSSNNLMLDDNITLNEYS